MWDYMVDSGERSPDQMPFAEEFSRGHFCHESPEFEKAVEDFSARMHKEHPDF
jgi:hypothetical protein